MLPVLHELNVRFGSKLTVGIVDIEENTAVLDLVALPRVPLYIIYVDGAEYLRVGCSPQQLQLAFERIFS